MIMQQLCQRQRSLPAFLLYGVHNGLGSGAIPILPIEIFLLSYAMRDCHGCDTRVNMYGGHTHILGEASSWTEDNS